MYRPQIATILALVALVSASPLLERINPDAAIAIRAAGECEKTAATKQQSCVEACKEDTTCIRDW